MKIAYNSPLVLTFSIACTILYVLNYLLAGQLTPMISLSAHFDFGSIYSYLTLFFYILGHASVDHLLGNLSFILLLGPIMEEKYGTKTLLGMIVFTAIITGILNILFFSSGLWGASGIVFMFIILVSFTNVEHGTIPLTFILILLLYVGREILNSLDADNVSQFAHIAGGIMGSILGFIVKKQGKTLL